MAMQMLFTIVLALANLHVALAARQASTMNQSIITDYAAHTCSEKAVRDSCACEKYSHGVSFNGLKVPNLFDAVGVAGAWLCDRCQDKFKWGFGCDVQCSEKCVFGCDFSGDCIVPPKCLKNWRTKGDEFMNEHGECAACEDGYFGPSCENECPANCGQTPEGKCTRGGKCYKCKQGYFGEDCSQECPSSCPTCVMEDRYVTDLEGKQLLWEAAGSCPGTCNGEFYGETCNQACPANCMKLLPSFVRRLGLGMIPSCTKQTGACRLCSNGWWGERCEETCSSACSGKACEKSSGSCLAGCAVGSGKWGPKCDQECPSGCAKGRILKVFEWVVIKQRQLVGYIANVTGHGDDRRYNVITDSGVFEANESELEPSKAACDQGSGVCKNGCKAGLFGRSCDKKCPEHTDPKSGCDRETGTPKKCVKGFYMQNDECVACSETCKSGKCDAKGKCMDGCEAGFYGKMCELSCSSKCEGHCDAKTTGLKDGVCQSCEGGYTGRFCQEKCHPTCLTCAPWAILGRAATTRYACTSCRDHGYNAEPVAFKKNSLFGFFENSSVYGACNCIENAFRHEGSAECVCKEPEDENFVERFELRPKKECRHVCKEGLREVFGHLRSICITNEIYKAVVRAESSGFQQGDCGEGFYEIPVGSGKECVPEDYVQDIITDEKHELP